MLTFPPLSSDAVAQYPLEVTDNPGVQVIRFIDGSGQRFSNRARALRKWKIKLEALNEDEIEAIERFFAGLSGSFGSFAFPDPISGNLVPNCTLDTDELVSLYDGVESASVSFFIKEINA